MRKAFLIGIVALLAIGCAAAFAQTRVEGPVARMAAPFTSEFIAITVKGNLDRDATVIMGAKERQLGGRSFLVGKGPEHAKQPRNWYDGKLIWVAIDDIVEIAELKDIDDVRLPVFKVQESRD